MKQQHYEWIAKIIDSCNNDFHFDCIDNLIQLFLQKEGDEQLADDLKILRNKKWNDIHLILD